MITTEQYIESLRKYRADNALYYDYSKTEYAGNDNKIVIICPTHGDFLQRAGDHRGGSGCPQCGREKAKNTNIEKYGTPNPSQSCMIKEKIRSTFVTKYGVDNPSKCSSVKKKKEITCLKNYGTKNPNQSAIVREKTEKTNIERYGVSFPMQNKEISKRATESKIVNGGFTKSNSSKEATAYIKQYITTRGYSVNQCAFADSATGLHEWGVYHNGKWVLYDLVVFAPGHRGDKTKIIEILEYHGPFHYTRSEAEMYSDQRAYPWKTNRTTIMESFEKDKMKEDLGKQLTNNYIVIRTRNGDL